MEIYSIITSLTGNPFLGIAGLAIVAIIYIVKTVINNIYCKKKNNALLLKPKSVVHYSYAYYFMVIMTLATVEYILISELVCPTINQGVHKHNASVVSIITVAVILLIGTLLNLHIGTVYKRRSEDITKEKAGLIYLPAVLIGIQYFMEFITQNTSFQVIEQCLFFPLLLCEIYGIFIFSKSMKIYSYSKARIILSCGHIIDCKDVKNMLIKKGIINYLEDETEHRMRISDITMIQYAGEPVEVKKNNVLTDFTMRFNKLLEEKTSKIHLKMLDKLLEFMLSR